MALSPDQIKGVFGKFKPVLDRAYTRTVNSIQGVIGKFKFILDETSTISPDPQTVTTQAATNIGIYTATGNGNITDTGGQSADARGFVYGTTSQSDPGNVAPGSSGYDSFVKDTGTFGVGAFTKSITVVRLTNYYIRAYSHNGAGHVYGAELSFLTLEPLDRKGSTVLRTTPNKTIVGTKDKDRTTLGTIRKDKTVLK